MLHPKMLCLPVVVSLVYGAFGASACGRGGQSPEPETADNARGASADQQMTATPMEPSPQAAHPTATWGAVPGPGLGATPPGMENRALPLALTDEQIVGITATVNEAEIEQAKLAQRKAQNPRVKKFASNMVSQHSKAKKQSQSIAKEADLTEVESPLERDLKGKVSQQTQILMSAEDTDFDLIYTDAQIEQHEAVLDMLSNQLIPNASDPNLKAELEDTRDMVQQHLSEAREIRRSLISAQSSGTSGSERNTEAGPGTMDTDTTP